MAYTEEELLDYLNEPLPISSAPAYWLSASASGQTIVGNSGNDAIYGVGGDTLVGGTGDDTFYVTGSDNVVVAPGGGIDTIDTYWGGYSLPDNVQNLIVNSTGYALGNSLNNVIVAIGSGEFTIDGGGGNNVLTGGTGENIFVHADDDSNDVITNFTPGIDKVRIENHDLFSFAAVQSDMQQVGSDVVLDLGTNDSLTFRNIEVSQFSAQDFMLPLDYSTLHPSFDDEFNSLNLSNGTSGTWNTAYWWAQPNGATLTANSELEWYINSNYAPTSSVQPWTVNNGILDITAAPAAPSIQPYIDNYQYTSGMLTSHDSFVQTYGYYEIKAEMPPGQGLWADFWLLPENGSWPPEIDAMEINAGNPTTLVTGVVSDSTGQKSYIGTQTPIPNATTGFHTYGVDWEPNTITWYFDGNEIYQIATPADLHQPMYMVVDLAVGGPYGNPNSSTPFPATLQVDYIHAYATTAAPPVISQLAPETGSISNGITTSDQLTLTGTAEGDSTVNIYDNAQLLGTATANGIGAWSFSTGQLSNGTNSFTATDTNAADNTSPSSSALAVTVDVPPDAPAVASFSPDSNSAGNITNSNHLALNGSAAADTTVSVYDGTAMLGSAQVDSTGAWTFATATLADGAHQFTATDTNAFGTSTASSALDVTVDTQVPNAPIISSASPDSNGTVAASHISLDGIAVANSTVTIYDGLTSIGSVQSNDAGAWTFSAGALADGAHDFTATDTNTAGTNSRPSAALDVTVKAVPTITDIIEHSNGTATFTGTSAVNRSVSVFNSLNGKLVGTATASATGAWSLDTGTLSTSAHTFTADATDPAGNSYESAAAVYSTTADKTLSGAHGGLTVGLGANDTFVFDSHYGLGANDSFMFGSHFGQDTVVGFNPTGANSDVIQFDHNTFNNFAAVLAHAAQVGNDVVITADAADSVTLKSVNKAALTANDFHFV